MGKDSASRRGWIKNIAIIFLVILLLLTFFSKTIMTYSLPEVSAQYTQYASISSAVKATGTVKANATHNVIYEADQIEVEGGVVQSREVVSVFFKDGQYVEKDAVILTLKGGATVELSGVEKELSDAKKAYDLALLNDDITKLNEAKTLDEAKKGLEDARKNLTQLEAKYTALLGGVDTTDIIKSEIKVIEDALELLREEKAVWDSKISEINGKISAAEGMIEDDILSTLTLEEKLDIAEKEFSSAERAYRLLYAEITELKETLDFLRDHSSEMSEAKNLTDQLKSLEESLAKKIKERNDIIESGDKGSENLKVLTEAYEKSSAAYSSYISEFSAEIECAKTLVKLYEAKVSLNLEKQKYTDAVSSGVTDEYALGVLLDNISIAENYYNIALRDVDALTPVFSDVYSGKYTVTIGNEGEIALDADIAKYSEFELEALRLKSKMDSDKAALDSSAPSDGANGSVTDTLIALNNEIAQLEDQIRVIRGKLSIIGMPEIEELTNYGYTHYLAKLEKEYTDLSAEFTEVEGKYNEAKVKVESLRKQDSASSVASGYKAILEEYKAELKLIESSIKDKEKELGDKNAELNSGSSNVETPESLLKKIDEAKTAITSLETNLKITEANLKKSTTERDLERSEQKKRIEELEKKIEAYKTAPETTEVKAPIAGRIVSVLKVPGEKVTSGETVANIEIADKGYICEITMSSDEARRIQVGSPCTISNSWYYTNVEATVVQIRADAASQGKNRIVRIEIRGDVAEGQSLTFSIGDKSQSYENVVPNSAIREDNDGKFVLVVDSKDTPLGVRYTARRVNVDVVAADNTKSAVSGVSGGDFVITFSKTPITDGQQIRLAEN